MSNELSPGGGGSTLNASQILAKLTGATTLAVGALLFGAGTALLTTLPPAANGLFLSLSGGVPTWSINPAGALPASYAIGDTLFASSASALSRLAAVAVGQVLVSNGIGVAPSWSASPNVTGIITAKPTTTAGIALDPNAAIGNFLLSLSPANITAARRWSFPDRSDTVAGLGAQTFTGAQTINGTITGLLGLVILGGTLGGPANLELGNVSGTATTPYIDFNTSATAVDYNVRLIASGAAAGLGAGTLTAFTSALIVNVDPGGNELLRVGGGVSALGPVGSRVAAGLTPTLRLERSSIALWDAAINALGGYEIIQTTPRLTISIIGSVTVPGSVSTGQLTATGVLSSLGTITTAQQVMDSTVTWNAGAVAFTGIKLNVTDTASAAGSLLLDLQVGGVSKFSVRKDGAFTITQLLATTGTITASLPAIDASQTWNSAGTTFTAINLSVTNLGSAAASLFLNLGSVFKIRKDGALVTNLVIDDAGAASNTIDVQVSTLSTFRITNTGITSLTSRPAATGSVTSLLNLSVVCAGTPTAGFGGDIYISLKDTVSSSNVFVQSTEWVDPTSATRKARSTYRIYDTAAREAMRIEASGTAAMIGFLGASASARITFPAWTGTATRTAIATSTATLANVAEAVKAIVDDLRTFGLYG